MTANPLCWAPPPCILLSSRGILKVENTDVKAALSILTGAVQHKNQVLRLLESNRGR